RSASIPRPGGQQTLGQQQERVGDQGQEHGQHDADDDVFVVLTTEPFTEDQLPQPSDTDQRRDADHVDGGDRGHPQTRDDHGYGDRDLHERQPPQWSEPHGRGGLAYVVGYLAQAVDHVREQDDQGVQGQRHDRGPVAEAGVGQHQEEQRDRRYRVEHGHTGQDRRVQDFPPHARQPER